MACNRRLVIVTVTVTVTALVASLSLKTTRVRAYTHNRYFRQRSIHELLSHLVNSFHSVMVLFLIVILIFKLTRIV